jgi:Tfp pilus assembly protein PilX
MKKNQEQKNKKGFTLLFAVLVSTLVLAVGSSVISMALRQIVLSGVGRDSQFAFYASNTGIECALYWDLNGGVTFATSSQSSTPSNVDCANNNASVEVTDSDVDFATSKFTLEFEGVGNNSEVNDYDPEYCVDVFVTKTLDTSGSRDRITTDSLSREYNTCDENNPRRIERGLELNY